MAKHTLKILRCSERFLKYVWPFYNIMHERVKSGLNALAGSSARHHQMTIEAEQNSEERYMAFPKKESGKNTRTQTLHSRDTFTQSPTGPNVVTTTTCHRSN